MPSGVSFGSSGIGRVSMLVARLSVYVPVHYRYRIPSRGIENSLHNIPNGLDAFEASVSSSQIDRVLYGSPVSPHSDTYTRHALCERLPLIGRVIWNHNVTSTPACSRVALKKDSMVRIRPDWHVSPRHRHGPHLSSLCSLDSHSESPRIADNATKMALHVEGYPEFSRR